MFDFTLFIFMLGHILFHLIWDPLDRAAYRRLVAAG